MSGCAAGCGAPQRGAYVYSKLGPTRERVCMPWRTSSGTHNAACLTRTRSVGQW